MSKKKVYQWISFLVFLIMVATNTVFAKSIPLQNVSFASTVLSQENTQDRTQNQEKKTEQEQKATEQIETEQKETEQKATEQKETEQKATDEKKTNTSKPNETTEQETKQNEKSEQENSQDDTVTQENMQLNVGFELESTSCVLMEASTGAILYAKEMDKEVEPASITKIMTLILIFEAIDSGKIKLEDTVSVSEHAASMGGSQVYLEPFETQTVNDMIKCISIASANDACVAMAEYVAGSEEEFVNRMNQKAEELGMKHTKFVNCCGLDIDGHYSSALDVALMSRELIMKHPEISTYATIWMDTITHVTKKGSSEFGLTNTNKLVRTYKGITGLKTGSTGKAKYCLSASANRNGMDMIAVVMGNPNPLQRFVEAGKLLDYGFANCSLYVDDHKDLVLPAVPVKNGLEETVEGKVNGEFHYLCLTDVNPDEIQREVTLLEDVTSPIEEGCTIGEVTYRYGDKRIGSVEIVAVKQIKEAKFRDYFSKILKKFFLSYK